MWHSHVYHIIPNISTYFIRTTPLYFLLKVYFNSIFSWLQSSQNWLKQKCQLLWFLRNHYKFELKIRDYGHELKITIFEQSKIFRKKSSSDRPNCYVYGIVGKLFKSVREWWLSHAYILKTLWVIQVSNLKKKTYSHACFKKHPWDIPNLCWLWVGAACPLTTF